MQNRIVISLLFSVFTFISLHAQSNIDYQKLMPKDYEHAKKLEIRLKFLVEKRAKEFNIQPIELQSIVFPELMRYSSFYDAIEISTLKVLYTTYGKEYANFSIGYFQMKPSFLERLIKDINKSLPKFKSSIITSLDTLPEGANKRTQVLSYLEDPNSQIEILCIFYKLMEVKYPKSKFTTLESKLRFYATAYNSGYWLSPKVLNKRMTQNFFTLDKLIKKRFYNYSDIVQYRFLN